MLFKILHGDGSRISTDITPFHEGYCYVTHDGYMYIDMNIGTLESPNNQRIKLNAKDADTLTGFLASTQVTHGDTLLSDILNTYILSIDYDTLAFDTTEIVVGTFNPTINTTPVLGQAILGQLVLA